MRKISFYGKNLNVYRAGLHTHSTVSEDGLLAPQRLIDLYAKEGYACLAFTDHQKMNPVRKYNSRGMTLISGMEVHPIHRHKEEIWHILALNLPSDFPWRWTYPQEAAEAMHQAGGILFLPHPYWTGYGTKLLSTLKHICGTEVFNGATREIGKQYSMESWDEFLEMGKDYTALAVDDVHHEHDLFRGWTMICAGDKSEKSLIHALRNGDFYASCGPEFYKISLKEGIFEAEFSPVVSAQLISNGRKGYQGYFDRSLPGEKPELHRKLHVNVSQMKPGFYIRCQLTAADGTMAWSNPIRRTGPGLNDFSRCGEKEPS